MNQKPIQLLFDAMYHGKYEFSDFAGGDIKKEYVQAQIKNRTIYKTTKKLKTYHTFLNLFLFEHIGTNKEVVFSYRKGVSAYDAVSKHAQSKYFFQTDISNFFSSINAVIIKRTIINGKEKAPILDIDRYLDRILELVTIDNSLPMGFATSPMISNTCLFEFDNKLQEYCTKHQLIYTRYSDDIIISSQRKECINGINKTISTLLEECFDGALRLNHNKSKFTWKGNKIKILGMVILPTGKITVDIKFKKDIEVLLFYYLNNKAKFLELEKVEKDLNTGIALISGYLNYVNTIDSDYLDKLRKKFGATIVDMFLHQSAK